MPLSLCSECGFICRVLWPSGGRLECPECDGQLEPVGRQALSGNERPRLIASLRSIDGPGRSRARLSRPEVGD